MHLLQSIANVCYSGTVAATTLPSCLHTSSRSFLQFGFRSSVGRRSATQCSVHMTLTKVSTEIISADLLDCLMIVTGLVFYCCTWSFSSLFTWLSNIRARWRPSVPKVCQMLGLDEFTETFIDPSCKIRGIRSVQFDAVFDPLTFWIAAVCLKSEAKV